MTAVLVLVSLLGAALLVGAGVIVGGELTRRERQKLAGHRWRLWRWEQELISAAAADGCPGCFLLRTRSGLQRSTAGHVSG